MTATPEALRAILRRDFQSFLCKSFTVLHPGQSLSATWLHEAMAHALSQCRSGASPRLIVTMPPRSLKSITFSVAWTAFLLGQDPSVRIMCVSYNDDLARRHSMDTRRIMESEWYRAAFPRTVLAKRTETDLETTLGGTRLATSIGGSVTGFGAEWIIIDDPLKAEDALSKTLRERVNTFFSGTLHSRLNDKIKGRIVLAMQRLHEDDLAGYLLAQDGWTELKLAAIAEEDAAVPTGDGRVHLRKKDDLLQPDRETLEILSRDRVAMGSGAFQAQYQQAPVPDEGNAIRREWLCEYVAAPDLSQGQIIQSLDTAQKTEPSNDYSVLTTWLSVGDNHYLIDLFRARCDYPTLRAKVIEQWDRHRPERLLIEDTGSGTGLLQDLRHFRGDIVTSGIQAKDSKSVRVGMASALIENRRMFLPKEADWLQECLTELLGFPAAKHDDIIDSIIQYLNWIRSRRSEGFFCYEMMNDDQPTPLSVAQLYGSRIGSPQFGRLF